MTFQDTDPLRILGVDDEQLILDLYRKILATLPGRNTSSNAVVSGADADGSSISFDTILCRQGDEAVEVVRESIEQNRPIAIAFIDMLMSPGPDGLWTAENIRSIDPYIQIVLVTGYSDIDIIELSRRVPPRDKLLYLQKPFQFQEIWQIASSLGAKWQVERQFRRIQSDLETMVEKRTSSLRKANIQLEKVMKGTIRAMAITVETRDPYTAGHQQRVAELSRAIAIEMGLPEEQIEGIFMAGSIHDLGKISVPAEILSKPGPITETEFSLIKTHPQSGHDILKSIAFSWPIAQIALQHHERMDGSGYPQGLSGEDILIEARILAVADVVESMASHRPYRPALGIEPALEEISRNKGIHFDSNVVDACLKLFDVESLPVSETMTRGHFILNSAAY